MLWPRSWPRSSPTRGPRGPLHTQGRAPASAAPPAPSSRARLEAGGLRSACRRPCSLCAAGLPRLPLRDPLSSFGTRSCRGSRRQWVRGRAGCRPARPSVQPGPRAPGLAVLSVPVLVRGAVAGKGGFQTPDDWQPEKTMKSFLAQASSPWNFGDSTATKQAPGVPAGLLRAWFDSSRLAWLFRRRAAWTRGRGGLTPCSLH